MTNSNLYRVLFYLSLSMAVSVFVLNKVLIDYMGIEGAALATLLVVFAFGVIRIQYVYRKLGMQPFDRKSLIVLGLIGVFFAVFFFIRLEVPPLIAIVIKSSLITLAFLFVVLRLKLSEDLSAFFDNFKPFSRKR